MFPPAERRRRIALAESRALRDRRIIVSATVALVTFGACCVLFHRRSVLPLTPETAAGLATLAAFGVATGYVMITFSRLKDRSLAAAFPTLCPTCGYDRRATPARCPECGTESPAAS